MNQHVLPPNLPEAAEAYIDSMPEGRVELFPLTPLDRTGVPCWNAIFLNRDGTRWHGVAPHGVGYGVDDASAIIGTTGELAEAVHSATSIHRMTRRTASYNALRAECGERGVADPVTLCLPAGSPVDGDTVLEWVPAQRWPGGETVWLPIDIAACSVGDLSPGYVPFTTPITNGLGAGPTLEFAIGHGLCELLQRDGNGTGFRAMDRGIALDLGDGPRDPRTRALLERLDALGIEVIPKFATDEFGTANVYCVGAERDGRRGVLPDHGDRGGRGGVARPRACAAQGAVRVRGGAGAQGVQPCAAGGGRPRGAAGLPGAVPAAITRWAARRAGRCGRWWSGCGLGSAGDADDAGGHRAEPAGDASGSTSCRAGTGRSPARGWSRSWRGGLRQRGWRSCSWISRRRMRRACTW